MLLVKKRLHLYLFSSSFEKRKEEKKIHKNVSAKVFDTLMSIINCLTLEGHFKLGLVDRSIPTQIKFTGRNILPDISDAAISPTQCPL